MMNTTDAKLIYLVSTPNPPTPQVPNRSSQFKQLEIKYERGEIDSADARLARDMCNEWVRQQTFESWKHTRSLVLMLSKFGFFLKCESVPTSALVCSFCKGCFIFK